METCHWRAYIWQNWRQRRLRKRQNVNSGCVRETQSLRLSDVAVWQQDKLWLELEFTQSCESRAFNLENLYKSNHKTMSSHRLLFCRSGWHFALLRYPDHLRSDSGCLEPQENKALSWRSSQLTFTLWRREIFEIQLKTSVYNWLLYLLMSTKRYEFITQTFVSRE